MTDITVTVTDSAGASASVTAVATVGSSTSIIPTNRMVAWKPGVALNGGFPNRTIVFKTLTPRGGSLDDTAQIEAALNACPDNQIVQLTAGTFNITGNGLSLRRSNVTLRGAGPGNGGGTGTLTKVWKSDFPANPNYGIFYIGNDFNSNFGTSINLTVDAVKGTNSCTIASNPGIQVGEVVWIDQVTNLHPDVWWGNQHEGPGGGSRRWFVRQDRSLSQVMKVAAVSGTTITFETSFGIDFKKQFTAQLTRVNVPCLTGIGVEDIYFYNGGNGDWHGAVNFTFCQYSWVKHIETHWVKCAGHVGLYGCYRCESRDSYHHESPNETPGGDGYLVSLNYGTSDCLIENNIMWKDNKNIVMRGAGPGNVAAYNYMDDAYGANYPSQVEAGVNAGHYTTPHMILLEGNYAQNYKGDDFWGNSIYITVLRNHLSAIRVAHPPLNTYSFQGEPYMDLFNRTAVDIQAHSNYTNFVGNILGKQGQVLLHYHSSSWNQDQTSFAYEDLTGASPNSVVSMWNMGSFQDSAGNWQWLSTEYQSQLRQGNFDWVTQRQIWYANLIGGKGSVSDGTPQTIPDSLYLTSKPAFFGANPWPWVDPSTGLTTVLPAKARFDAGTPNQL